jgi:hypothetical protein
MGATDMQVDQSMNRMNSLCSREDGVSCCELDIFTVRLNLTIFSILIWFLGLIKRLHFAKFSLEICTYGFISYSGNEA